MLDFKVTPIFPVGLYQARLDSNVMMSSLPHLREFVKESTYSKDMVVHSVSSFNRYILESQQLTSLKLHLEEHLEQYKRHVIGETTDRFKLYITMSWCTGLLPGNTHQEHNHANSIISGVMYFDNPPNASPFVLHKDDSSCGGFINLSPTTNTDFSKIMHFVPPINGTLLLFPSHLKHRVPKNETETQRNSLAFDTFFEGEIGASRNILKMSRINQQGI
jgi:uncharacterized protein (TIGR02466 family)